MWDPQAGQHVSYTKSGYFLEELHFWDRASERWRQGREKDVARWGGPRSCGELGGLLGFCGGHGYRAFAVEGGHGLHGSNMLPNN